MDGWAVVVLHGLGCCCCEMSRARPRWGGRRRDWQDGVLGRGRPPQGQNRNAGQQWQIAMVLLVLVLC